MAYDLKLSHSSLRLGRLLAAGTVVEAEGKIMVAAIEDGVEKASIKATVDGSEEVIGFSSTGDSLPDQTSEVESVTVPSAPAAPEVDLRNEAIVTGRVRAVVIDTAEVLTINTTFAGAAADGEMKIDLAKGRCKFHTDEVGKDVLVTYIFNLTTVLAKQRFGERFVNNRDLHAEFGQIEVQAGIGELYTDQFDASKLYDGSVALTIGDDGIVTTGGAGAALNATIVSEPSLSNPYLGIKFRFMP